MGFTTNQKQGFGGILYLFAFCQVCSRILAVPDLDEGVWEGQQTVSTISFDLLLAYPRRDCQALPTSYVYDPAWTQAKILRRKDGYNHGLYLHSPRHQLPVANRSVMLTLCIILSNDVQLNPGPPTSHRCAICDKSVAKKDHGIMCDECGMDVHIDCAGVPKRYFKRLKTEGKDWFCKACWAPCGMCDGDIFDGDKGLECDVCNKWIHPLCCGIDSKTYELLPELQVWVDLPNMQCIKLCRRILHNRMIYLMYTTHLPGCLMKPTVANTAVVIQAEALLMWMG